MPNGRLGTFIEHTYIQEKTFTVRAEARNPVSSVTSEVSFEITGMNCSQPQVDDCSVNEIVLHLNQKQSTPPHFHLPHVNTY